jgi:Fic family protein
LGMDELDILKKRIMQKKAEWDSRKPLPKELLENLEQWFRVELTYTSNAIEGNTLNAQETALVVEKGITVEGKTVTEHLEARNHALAVDAVTNLAKRDSKKITLNDILAIHGLILKDIDTPNAGKFRNVPVRVAGSRTIFPNPQKVPDLMDNLEKWLNSAKTNALEKAALAHLKLVTTHPFTDGNGRVARLLMNLILMQNGFPPAAIKPQIRGKYIASLEKAQFLGKEQNYFKLVYSAVLDSLNACLEFGE